MVRKYMISFVAMIAIIAMVVTGCTTPTPGPDPDPDPKMMINPFAIAEIREAMNWLIDRDFIVEEHLGGAGAPRITALPSVSPDAVERYPHIVAAIEEYYAYNPTKAKDIITAKMEEYGAVLSQGRWRYDGELVEIIVLIRADLAPYPESGQYVADQLESLGFEVKRLVLPGRDAGPIWTTSLLPVKFHVYTGGWGATIVPRDSGGTFDQMYTHRVMPFPVFTGLEAELTTDFPLLDEASRKLAYKEFTSLAAREALFEFALWESLRFSNCVWTADVAGLTALRPNFRVGACLFGGVMGSRVWPHTLHAHNNLGPVVGGTARVSLLNMLVEPWNPVDGTSWSYDLWHTRNAMGDAGVIPSPIDGLFYPQRIAKAEITVKTGLPVARTLDWLTLDFASSIPVPADAWAEWDPVNQKFITVGEKFPAGKTVERKSVVYYPKDIFDHPIHDGSTLSIGDFMMSAIVGFERGQEASPIYDASNKGALTAFLNVFGGVKFITDDPDWGLIVEDYRDTWFLDAEWSTSTWFPSYGTYGESAPWHTIAMSWLAEEAKVMAWSADKADELGVEIMDWTKGDSLPKLKGYLDQAQAASFIPYQSFLSAYITPAEITERYANLQAFYAEYGHFWADYGIFRLKSVFPVEKTVVLERFPEYPDPADKWLWVFDPAPVNVPARTGAWVDEVVVTMQTSHATAVQQMKANQLDLFAWPITDATLREDILANLSFALSFGNYRDLRFNTVGNPYYQVGE